MEAIVQVTKRGTFTLPMQLRAGITFEELLEGLRQQRQRYFEENRGAA